LELELFLSEHGVDICLLNETHLVAKRALRFVNYLFNRTDRHTPGGGTAIPVHKGIDQCAVPVSELQYLEATPTYVILATRPVKLVWAYLAPTRPFTESDVTECLSGGIPGLMAGDHKAKHNDWNSRLTTARRALLRDYADRNSCLIYGPESPTTAHYTHNATPDVFDIVVVKDFVLQIHLTAQNSVQITCRS
jgi:hypothetical protein